MVCFVSYLLRFYIFSFVLGIWREVNKHEYQVGVPELNAYLGDTQTGEEHQTHRGVYRVVPQLKIGNK